MERKNALWNCKNPNQGEFPKALCICSAGLLRSPTVAWVLGNNGYNTRAAGLHDYALIPVDEVLLEWADHVIVMEKEHLDVLMAKFPKLNKVVTVLGIDDCHEFRSPALVRQINEVLKEEKFF